MTEADDYLRLAFAKLGEIYCYSCHQHIKSRTIDEVINLIYSLRSEEGKEAGKE
jgi:excinuclease ABC subunit A